MVTGSIAGLGVYWNGSAGNPWDFDDFNAKGYFEDIALLEINELLLATCLESPYTLAGLPLPDPSEATTGRYLCLLDPEMSPYAEPRVWRRMEQFFADKPPSQPYCLKDPRLSYTLSCWRPLLADAVFLCVFRDPMSTAKSLVRYCSGFDVLRPLHIDLEHGLELWACMNRRILDQHSREGDWLFLHARQMFGAEGHERLEEHLGGRIDRGFVEDRLMTPPQEEIPPEYRELYQELCNRAGY